ncbi:MAG: hypothetical protein J6V76_02970 [Bacteroidales bacterium]|nr:hypothetical protein [Bacteroidales bacterium]
MRTIILIIFFLLFYCHAIGQKIKITSDSLWHYLQQKEDLYSCFNNRNIDPVIDNFIIWNNEKDFYFNDSLKHQLIDIFNDSISWAKYAAKCVRHSLENETDEYKHNALKGFLRRKFDSKAFADSILKDATLFEIYFDSLCTFEENRSFEEGLSRIGYFYIPYRLKKIISHSYYFEVYNKMLYYWKQSGCSNRDFYYVYLLNVGCPDVISELDKMLDNSEWDYDLINYLTDNYSSESIKLLIKALDKTYLVDGDLMEIDVSLNVKLLLRLNRLTWFTEIGYLINSDLYYKVVDIIRHISANIYEPKGNELMAKYIIENKDIIVPFFETAYKKCSEQELYWKQNMPYYKKE